jgi:glutathione gamma-glutamylcysteinyltransferase
MVLNALNYDPKRVWKGPWRWVSEEMLQCESTKYCCHSIEKVRNDGMNFTEFESLARCHNVNISSQRVLPEWSNESPQLIGFKKLLKEVSSSDRAESFLVANFSRKALGQTGIGHFSPIGGYHFEKDLVLILDVARFKYPPFWVSSSSLWSAMQVQDDYTGLSRGYFRISIDNNETNISEGIIQGKSAEIDISSKN